MKRAEASPSSRRANWALTLLAVLSVLSVMSACTTVGPNYQVPAQAALQRPSAQAAFIEAKAAPVSLEPLPAHWWKLYQSGELDALVEQALLANTTLRVAEAHLRHATAVLDQVDGERDPHVGAVAAVRRAQESGEAYLIPEKVPVVNEGDLGLQVSYQLDLWGQLKRGEEAASANWQAVEAAQDLARVNVVAQTVQAYVQICNARQERAVAEQRLAVQQRVLTLAQRLLAAGRGTPAEVLRAQGLVDAQSATLPHWDAERDAAFYRLAALLGRTPQEMPTDAARCATPLQLAQPIPVGDGAELLKRRPDVRQAERQLAGASARIGVATADLYPSISIGASIGTVGVLGDLGRPATNEWGFGPLLSWHLPDKASKARVKMAEADEQASLAQFDGVVLQALQETETALSRYRHDLERQQAQRAARDKAAELAQEQRRIFEAGRQPYAISLEAQKTLSGAEASLAAIDSAVMQDQVSLFLALGGGWE